MIVKRIRRAKLFIFLRKHRHEVFDGALQEELTSLYQDSPRGQPPVAPALSALATILQVYTGASDDEVIEASQMDRRWQLVLDCLDAEEAPFSKGTLVAFRQRLIEANMDRRLIEWTLEVARQVGAFGAGALRTALDSSPLWGAGRVEDTYNLLGHALRKALGVIAVRASVGAGRGGDGGQGAGGGEWVQSESGPGSELGRPTGATRGALGCARSAQHGGELARDAAGEQG